MAGPGGAYGPVRDTGAPYPGQPVPVQVGMAKPPTITGIKVILWIFSAISALGDVAAVMSLVDYFSALGIVMLLVTIYFTVQSAISPIHIERGKRWAWIWSVISAALGLVGSLVSIALTVEFGGGTVLLSVALGALYGVLFVLLLTPSARAWILMHRIQRGEVQAASAPGAPDASGAMGVQDAAGAMGAAGVQTQQAAPPERPSRKPGAVTAVQVLLLLMVIPMIPGIPALLEEFRHMAGVLEGYSSVSDYMSERGLWWLLIVVGVASLAVLAFNSIIAWHLGKGRRWARIVGAIWLGALVLLAGFGTFGLGVTLLNSGDNQMMVNGEWVDDTFDRVWAPILLYALCAGFVLAVTAFCLMLVRGTRAWTPGRPPKIVMIQQPQPQQQQQPPQYPQQPPM